MILRSLHLFWHWKFQSLMAPMVLQWNLMKSTRLLYWMVENQLKWLFRTTVFNLKDQRQSILSKIAIVSIKKIFTAAIQTTSTIKWIIAYMKSKTWRVNSMQERFDLVVLFSLNQKLYSGMQNWVRQLFRLYCQDFLRWYFCQHNQRNWAYAWKTDRWTKCKLVST